MVKDKIIFIDSDGTVMDSMTLKHKLCFGPALITTYGLEDFKDDILEKWNYINLYSKTRGINRFDGEYQILEYVNQKYMKIDFLADFKCWLDTTKQKSNDSLENYIKDNQKYNLQKVLDWSILTNRLIVNNQELVKPFANVRSCLYDLHKDFKIIIISSANKAAVMHEWEKFGLIDLVDEICTQEVGSKEQAIKNMLQKYNPKSAIMLGDALNDLNASKANKIFFYPIVFDEEDECWSEFNHKYALEFKMDNYKQYESKLIDNFLNKLLKEA